MVLCLSSCLCAEVLDLFFVLPGQGVTGQKGYPGFPGEEGVAVSSSLTHVFIHPLIHSFTADDDQTCPGTQHRAAHYIDSPPLTLSVGSLIRRTIYSKSFCFS